MEDIDDDSDVELVGEAEPTPAGIAMLTVILATLQVTQTIII